jgi:FG-GAP-like repeat
MLPLRLTIPLLSVLFCGPSFADWQASSVKTPGSVIRLEADESDIRIAIGKAWYRLNESADGLEKSAPFERPKPRAGAIPDARVAVGRATIARAWLAEPTERYRHGILGDAIEAGSLIIARRDGTHGTLRLGADAVFEDIEPRIATIGGAERIVVVKSYLTRGSAVAIVDPVSASIIAETVPIGHAHAWVSPAGIADFDGDGAVDIALVRQPHVVGLLEIWSWRQGRLTKSAEIADVSNHFIGSRSLHMSYVADFDGDGFPDIAVPDRERRRLRLISLAPAPHEIARIELPARISTDIGGLKDEGGRTLVFGLEDGQLMLVRHR